MKPQSTDNSTESTSSAEMTRFSIPEDDLVAESSRPILKKRRIIPEPDESDEYMEPEDQEIDSEYQSEDEDEDEEEEEEDDEEEGIRSIPAIQTDPDRVSEGRSGNGSVSASVTDPDRVSEGRSGNGPVPATLTDPDVFDCPICFDSLTLPVFQCENGHIACAFCCTRIFNKCPSCTMPIGYNRCRAIERVIESVKVPCRNTKYGCTTSVICSKKSTHEPICAYTPCSCPLESCHFLGSHEQVYTHFRREHKSSAQTICFNYLYPISLKKNQRCLYIQDKPMDKLFVVNHRAEHFGHVVNVICIAPVYSKMRYSYVLVAGDGESSIKLESVAENIPKWCPNKPLKMSLLVPNELSDFTGQLKLEVCIKGSRDSRVVKLDD